MFINKGLFTVGIILRILPRIKKHYSEKESSDTSSLLLGVNVVIVDFWKRLSKYGVDSLDLDL